MSLKYQNVNNITACFYEVGTWKLIVNITARSSFMQINFILCPIHRSFVRKRNLHLWKYNIHGVYICIHLRIWGSSDVINTTWSYYMYRETIIIMQKTQCVLVQLSSDFYVYFYTYVLCIYVFWNDTKWSLAIEIEREREKGKNCSSFIHIIYIYIHFQRTRIK